MVFTVCLGAVLIPLRAIPGQLEDRQFFNQLERDLLEAQTYAITKNSNVSVNFFEGGKNIYRIYTVENPRKILAKREIPLHFIYHEKSLPTLTFLKSGMTSKFGTVHFITAEKTIKLVFSLGRGRFYFLEE